MENTISEKPVRDKPAIRVIPPKLYGAFLLAGIVFNFIVPLRPFDFWSAFFPGFFLVLGGVGLGVWSFKAFQKAQTNIRIDRPATCVVTSGPYGFSRNPIYIALNLIYIGGALMFNSGWALLGLIPVLVIMHYRVILKEEAYLEQKFGPVYLDYKGRVRRWI